ncbi:MAG: rhodanese-like domain-containing protein [Phycisphaerae bacterium]
MTTTVNGSNTIVEVAPDLVSKWIASRQAVLVDVREDFEYAAERIASAEHHPLTTFDADRVRSACGDRRVVFYCRSGRRSADAARRYQSGTQPVFHLAGGIQAWKSAGMDTIRAPGAPRVDVMRQTQIAIGTIVLAGTLLGAFVSPWFLILSGFMGAGLIFAGASGTCGLALLMGRMPWNRVASASTCGGACRTGGAA